MEDTGQEWLLTLYFLDATGKKEVANSLDFRSAAAASDAMAPFIADADRSTRKVFRIENEDGEYIEFLGATWRRHTLKRSSSGFYLA